MVHYRSAAEVEWSDYLPFVVQGFEGLADFIEDVLRTAFGADS